MNGQALLRGVLAGCLAVLAGCGAPASRRAPEIESGVTRALEAGGRAFARGNVESAAASFEAALREAERTDDAVGRELALYNLAVVALDGGDPVRAETWLARAEGSASTRLLGAAVRLRTSDAEGAKLIVDGILAGEGVLSASEREEAWVLLAEASEMQGDVGAAEDALARIGAGATGAPLRRARVRAVRAWVAGEQGRDEDRALELDARADALRESASWESMAKALRSAGEAWLAAGDPVRGADRLLRAARSFAAQEMPGDVRACLDAGREIPGLDARTRAELRALEPPGAATRSPD